MLPVVVARSSSDLLCDTLYTSGCVYDVLFSRYKKINNGITAPLLQRTAISPREKSARAMQPFDKIP